MDHTNQEDGPYGLVLAPTRELVQQIEDECAKFCRFMKLKTYSIVGGVKIEDQVQHCGALCSTVQHCGALWCIVVHCEWLQCAAL